MQERGNLFADGAAYERMMGRWSQPVGEQFLDWLALPNGLRCLDVGCGNGAFTEVLIRRARPAAVTGIDPSEQQLAYARTRPVAKLAQFQQGSADALPFADNSFDAAIMALVITFVPDPARAVAEMARVVRPGGSVGTYMWDAPGGGLPVQPIYDTIRDMGISPPRSTNMAASGQEAMRGFWQRAGLEAIETRVIHIPVMFKNFDELWSSNTAGIGPLGKVLNEMPTASKEELKARVRERVPRDSQGRIAYEAFANAVKGRVPVA
jgi:ubiquinone/menaquinone biosynthesis C-methylase UbiE